MSTELKINIFFDGTCNNGRNIDGGEKNGDSYSSSYSNIYRLFLNSDTTNSINIYIDGIGTSEGEKDSRANSALGDYNDTNFSASGKINLANEQLQSEIQKKIKENEKYDITFNLFGFSRGATLARYYAINLLNDSAHQHSKKNIKENWKSCFNNNLNSYHINFIGLFDTVESIKTVTKKTINYDTNLQNIAKTVYQITALHECRANYPLTTIIFDKKSRGNCNKLGTGSSYLKVQDREYIEICLPGAHADIGGGYLQNTKEKVALSEWLYEIPLKKEATNRLKELSNDVIWGPIVKKAGLIKNRVTHPLSAYLQLERDNLEGNLQLVYLLLMAETANKKGCNFNLETLYAKYKPFLSNNYNRNDSLVDYYKYAVGLNEKVLNNEIFQNISNEVIKKIQSFIHFSADYNGYFNQEKHEKPSSIIIKAPSPNSTPSKTSRIDRTNEPTKNWVRDIIG